MHPDVHTAFKAAFTEEMKGFLTLGEVDYDRGYRQGRQDNTALMFHLTITIDGVNRFITIRSTRQEPRATCSAPCWVGSDP